MQNVDHQFRRRSYRSSNCPFSRTLELSRTAVHLVLGKKYFISPFSGLFRLYRDNGDDPSRGAALGCCDSINNINVVSLFLMLDAVLLLGTCYGTRCIDDGGASGVKCQRGTWQSRVTMTVVCMG